MGIIRKHSLTVLLVIIVAQLMIIGIFAYTDKISSVTTSKNITAIISENDNRYLLIRNDNQVNTYNVDDQVRYLNHDNQMIHLFNNAKEYLATYQFDDSLNSYEQVLVDNIAYIDTNFVCKQSICMINKASTEEYDGKVQIFPVKNQSYIYLDADKI